VRRKGNLPARELIEEAPDIAVVDFIYTAFKWD